MFKAWAMNGYFLNSSALACFEAAWYCSGLGRPDGLRPRSNFFFLAGWLLAWRALAAALLVVSCCCRSRSAIAREAYESTAPKCWILKLVFSAAARANSR